MTILIVEDDPVQLSGLTKIIQTEYKDAIILPTDNYDDAVTNILSKKIDFFIFDVMLDEKTEEDPQTKDGIALGKIVREQLENKNKPILYLTSLFDRAIEAINETHCYGYLLKPYDEESVKKTIKDMIKTVDDKDNNMHLRFKDRYGVFFQVETDHIIHIESYRKSIIIRCDNNTYETRDYTLTNLSKLLPDAFVQCHKSHIINLKYTQSYDKTFMQLTLTGNTKENQVPVGRQYKSHFEERLFNYE